MEKYDHGDNVFGMIVGNLLSGGHGGHVSDHDILRKSRLV